jgi:hypothetical protein
VQQTITWPGHLSYVLKLRFNIILLSLSDLQRPFPLELQTTDIRSIFHLASGATILSLIHPKFLDCFFFVVPYLVCVWKL